MPRDIIDAAFRRILPSPFAQHQITVVWHAGEPLALPAAWYEDAFDLAERYRPPALQVDHHFQSNGMLIDPAWIKLLQRPNMHMGLSIDGPADIHDRHRRTRGGDGTHARAMRGAAMLRDASIPFHVITVLTEASLDHADALFDFYRDHGMHSVAFNIDEIDGVNQTSSLCDEAVEQRFRHFLRRFGDRMAQNPGVVALRELDDAHAVIRARGLHGCLPQDAEPMRIISVDVDGNVATFSPELLGTTHADYGNFCFGNVLTDSIEIIADRAEGSQLLADIRTGIAACAASCAWFNFCGGGSPSNKLGETGSVQTSETMYCRMMRQGVLEVTLELIEQSMLATVHP